MQPTSSDVRGTVLAMEAEAARETAKSKLVLGAHLKLLQAAETVARDTYRHLSEAGLTLGQFLVLDCVYRSGPLMQKELVEKTCKTPASITRIVDTLEENGLVIRRKNGRDRRASIVHITDVGRRSFERVYPRHLEWVEGRVQAFSDEQLRDLGALCESIGFRS